MRNRDVDRTATNLRVIEPHQRARRIGFDPDTTLDTAAKKHGCSERNARNPKFFASVIASGVASNLHTSFHQ
jgi:hypothetical protein